MSAFHPAAIEGLYVERADSRPGSLERQLREWAGLFGRIRRLSRRQLGRELESVERAGQALGAASDEALRERALTLGIELRRHGFRFDLAHRAFALARESAGRRLGMRHYDSQLAGGWQLLLGRLAEMETGEGKTLTATLPATAAALAGIPVHVVTVNDYLAKRDAEAMAPLYESFGLRVGIVLEESTPEERRAAYAADVTYVTNKQLAFDFLRDRLTLAGRRGDLRLRLEGTVRSDAAAHRLLLRGLAYAIVDEADSVLIDEARTPLILSATQEPGEEEQQYFQRALALARSLEEGRDFELRTREWTAVLSERGRERLCADRAGLGGLWGGRRRREELVSQALLVLHAFRRDDHYLVRSDKIQVIDEYTGRVMADRAWSHGIQQLLELKEGCSVTGVRDPLARISYQRFFRRYLHLAGMTGTAAEVARELRSTYGLRCTHIPTHRPLQRVDHGERIYATLAEKWEAVADRVAELRAAGRAVLVGTRSVASSDELAAVLERRAIPFRVLTARQDREEAEIVARAGEAGEVMVATNMAGRGTDIPLGEGVAARGGLAVLLTERHEAGRIDRQLAGRSGRQGDPGSAEAFLSLEDTLVERFGRRALLHAARALGSAKLSALAIRSAQRRAERLHRRVRAQVLRTDREQADALAFSGSAE